MPNEQTLQYSGINELANQDQIIDSIQQSIANKSLQLLGSFGKGLTSLSRKLAEQIKSNQCVDFADLFPAQVRSVCHFSQLQEKVKLFLYRQQI